MDKNSKKIIWLGFIILFFVFLIFVLVKNTEQNISSISPPLSAPTQIEKTGQAFLEIDEKKLETLITKEENIYDFMVKLKKERKIDFKEKNYYGMGMLIEEINGVKNGDKNWIYYVNGKKATIGVSNYQIKPGDVVSWKYEKNN
ncbi:MAG: DUF4430 domain-containing protein [Candidatus Paceibacterota bacterium]|jgi:hypothetical protein